MKSDLGPSKCLRDYCKFSTHKLAKYWFILRRMIWTETFVIQDLFDLFSVSLFRFKLLWTAQTHTQKHRYPHFEHLSELKDMKQWECSSGVLSGFDLWYVLNVGVRDNRLGAGDMKGEVEGDRHDGHTGPWNLPLGVIFIGKFLSRLILTCLGYTTFAVWFIRIVQMIRGNYYFTKCCH